MTQINNSISVIYNIDNNRTASIGRRLKVEAIVVKLLFCNVDIVDAIMKLDVVFHATRCIVAQNKVMLVIETFCPISNCGENFIEINFARRFNFTATGNSCRIIT